MSSASYSYIGFIANISISSDFATRKTTIFPMPPMLSDGDVTAPELPRTLTTPAASRLRHTLSLHDPRQPFDPRRHWAALSGLSAARFPGTAARWAGPYRPPDPTSPVPAETAARRTSSRPLSSVGGCWNTACFLAASQLLSLSCSEKVPCTYARPVWWIFGFVRIGESFWIRWLPHKLNFSITIGIK